MYYSIEPEVSGQLGPETILDSSIDPPIVTYLQFVFHGWLGDDLIECFPVYLVSERLALKIKASDLTGYEFRACDVDVSDQFSTLQHSVQLPKFSWLQVGGGQRDDFQIVNKRLLLSAKAYELLSEFSLRYAAVEVVE